MTIKSDIDVINKFLNDPESIDTTSNTVKIVYKKGGAFMYHWQNYDGIKDTYAYVERRLTRKAKRNMSYIRRVCKRLYKYEIIKGYTITSSRINIKFWKPYIAPDRHGVERIDFPDGPAVMTIKNAIDLYRKYKVVGTAKM